MLTIVTGASQNHVKSLLQFIRSFLQVYKSDPKTRLVIYNLGLEPEGEIQVKLLTADCSNVFHKTFEYTNYPDYFNINVNAGEYAWKPNILYETCKEYGNNVVWMDAGNLILNRLDELEKFIEINGIHSGLTAGTIKDWTHPTTLQNMRCDPLLYSLRNRNGACIGVNYNLPWVQQFVEDWKNYSFRKEVIAPEGSSRQNHRQDQAVFSVLFYQYYFKYFFGRFDHWFYQLMGYSIHNDCD